MDLRDFITFYPVGSDIGNKNSSKQTEVPLGTEYFVPTGLNDMSALIFYQYYTPKGGNSFLKVTTMEKAHNSNA